MTRVLLLLVAAALPVALGAPSNAAGVPAAAVAGCPAAPSGGASPRRLVRVLGAGRDVWGERLLAAPEGPTLIAARRFLAPLLYATGPGGRRLTTSGVYYLPFTLPLSVGGDRGFGLHVADGSEIIVRRVGGPALSVEVGARGDERFGTCLARLSTPALADGYLPILQVAYRDRAGVRYREESFVGRLPRGRSLVSFVRVVADASTAARRTTVRLRTSAGAMLRMTVQRGETAELDAAFVHAGPRLVRIGPERYAAARSAVVASWARWLDGRASFVVPEPAVLAAERASIVQELEMTWRYSVGNTYEELSYAEALDVAQVMAEYGYGDVARQILRFAVRQLPVRFTNWRAGERLVAGAQYFRLSRDDDYVAEETPALARVVGRLAHELASSETGLLPRERYSSDIATQIYSLQGQTLVWEGLRDMGRVWAITGHAGLARRCGALATRLGHGLRRAVEMSARRLPDGSLFVPVSLFDPAAPFRRLTSSIDGTYWNLVAPYAFASGFFGARGAAAAAIERYLLLHGARLLGLVRAGAYRLQAAGSSLSGTDQVYGVNVSRFLADRDDPDQLVLSLYGTLAAALTPGTYVSGEAASLSPLRGGPYRAMYLPPNAAGAAAFLETLRLALVHETRSADGRPSGLELAYAAPRGWLADGKSTVVNDAPTSFGPVAFSISRRGPLVQVAVDLPASPAPPHVRLRLRLPRRERLRGVATAGHALPFDARTGTIDLSGETGHVELTAAVASRNGP